MTNNRSFVLANPGLNENNISWAKNDYLKDILKLFKSQTFSIALPEWRFFIKDFSTHELLSLASYLSDIQIYDRSISAAIYSQANMGSSSDIPLFIRMLSLKLAKKITFLHGL